MIALCLFFGATGKSAQIPLYVWLPDAMEGPTPVSALIHAATMVTAGVYMVVRLHFLFDRSIRTLAIIAIVASATAFLAALIALVQNDIKRVLAYSTISQLGYMFLGCAASAYSTAIFHLMTHAFFKALFFLGAGSVIHSLGGEQDLRKMGGLRKKIPFTFWAMTAPVFAITGLPPFSGFVSKDAILYEDIFRGTPRQVVLVRGTCHGIAHVFLYVSAVVYGLLGGIAQSRISSPREPVDDAWPTPHFGHPFADRRMDRHRPFRSISQGFRRTASRGRELGPRDLS